MGAYQLGMISDKVITSLGCIVRQKFCGKPTYIGSEEQKPQAKPQTSKPEEKYILPF